MSLSRFTERAFLTKDMAIDKENGVIKGVKIVNSQSVKNREYTETALQDVARLSEGARVFDQHSKTQAGGRSTRDQFGILRNTRKDGNGVIGDFHVSARERWILEDAERLPDTIVLSINGAGKVRKGGPSGKTVVESVQKMESVDLVPFGGTTISLFESAEEESNMGDEMKSLTLKQLRENRPDLVEALESEANANSESERTILDLKQQLKESAEREKALKEENDRFKVQQALAEKKQKLDGVLQESGLPEEAVTESFRQILEGLDPKDWNAAIEDRKKLVEDAANVHAIPRGIGGKGGDSRVPTSKDLVGELRD